MAFQEAAISKTSREMSKAQRQAPVIVDAVAKSPRVRRLELEKLDPLDDVLSLMYLGMKGMTREADEVLGVYGLSRAHHRIMFVIARRIGISVGQLHAHLGVSAQATHRPLRQLQDAGCVAATRDPDHHRYKRLQLTELGRRVEQEASENERRIMRCAFEAAGCEGEQGWRKVMSEAARSA